MEKTIYGESDGLWYELRGDYYIPPTDSTGSRRKTCRHLRQRHLRYIKKEHKTLHAELLTSGRVYTYLADVNKQATEQMLLLTKQVRKFF